MDKPIKLTLTELRGLLTAQKELTTRILWVQYEALVESPKNAIKKDEFEDTGMASSYPNEFQILTKYLGD